MRIVLSVALLGCCFLASCGDAVSTAQSPLPKGWKAEQVTSLQAANRYLADCHSEIEFLRQNIKRDGENDAKWDEHFQQLEIDCQKSGERFNVFLSRLRKGDQLWRFRTSESSWAQLHGREGYVIVRDGQTVAEHLTRQN